jgi:hypothetical protein
MANECLVCLLTLLRQLSVALLLLAHLQVLISASICTKSGKGRVQSLSLCRLCSFSVLPLEVRAAFLVEFATPSPTSLTSVSLSFFAQIDIADVLFVLCDSWGSLRTQR